MGTSTSARQLAGKFHKMAVDVNDGRKLALPGARLAEGILERHASQAGLVKGDKIAGSPWAGVYNRPSRGYDDGHVVGYSKPAHLVNDPTERHVIGARRLGSRNSLRSKIANAGTLKAFGGSGRGLFGTPLAAEIKSRTGTKKRKGARALKMGGRFAAYAFHPGTSGKQFFQRALPEVQKRVPPEVKKAVGGVLGKVFG
jgi:hypothetical protein